MRTRYFALVFGIVPALEATRLNLNDALKDAGIYDVAQWRQIQRLGDIRNLCGHAATRDPTADEVQDLIDGVAKVVAPRRCPRAASPAT